ncbi:sensory rhodopsin transducer [Alicyclobacillus acidoterrestris]|uniref:Sensory rhodopsin transducer n=1 Tax=Alicyclobacillus acidoterrestris (strain ATCC 49025 / DSM 3922 / CIP 106132 / NCIMB 13137 / GD3B) TaxID=1356854 RepID=T0CJ66_ALIAG|nr:sensory rhodopsin transducer [Alicyclobacillus acidoterrestris]EPZ52530.1 hypothetical protein N007_02790 [Alicyclobacillus acidoterrestris ATCC 49025]UNO50146.1 sensory rhodopsin transducer [Alicyclobacillus acidoterrestris]
MIGKTTWVIADGYLPTNSTGNQVSHEAVCVLNLTPDEAVIQLTVYFEDRDPLAGFTCLCGAQRTNHIRLDRLVNDAGEQIPRGVPYALKIDSTVPVIVQHSRMDTSQEALALFTTMGYSG